MIFELDKFIPKYIQNMESYKVGENISNEYIKLNSNENPYIIPEKIIKNTLNDLKSINFGLYPDEMSIDVRKKAAKTFGIKKENVLVDNGSSSILSLLFRLFVNKSTKLVLITPTFPYYYTLAKIENNQPIEYSWNEDFSLPFDKIKISDFDILFLPNPSAPTGHKIKNNDIEKLLKLNKLIVVDEAYFEFSGSSSIKLLKKYPNLIIVRSFSKSQSSASLRIGFCFAHENIIQNLDKIRPINNFNVISQKITYNILDNYKLFDKNINKIKRNRKYLYKELKQKKFEVIKSHTNFILVKPPYKDGEFWYEEIKKNKILLRYFPKLKGFNLRVTVGRRKENKKLLKIIDNILDLRNENDTI